MQASLLTDKRIICQAQSLRLLCSHNRAPDSLPTIMTWEMNVLQGYMLLTNDTINHPKTQLLKSTTVLFPIFLRFD